MKYCFLDLETTGLDPKKDSIIEISFVVQDSSGAERERLDEVIIPERSPLTSYVTHITGITEKEISECGKRFSTLIPAIQDRIGDAIIVGHNIDFDIGFLEENGIHVRQNGRIDTHELARIVLLEEESYALEILSGKYGFAHVDAHRAMSDVEACVDLLAFLKKQISSLPPLFLESVRPILEQKTKWDAKHFFLEASGDINFSFEKSNRENPTRQNVSLPGNVLERLSPQYSLFIEAGDSSASADALMELTQRITDKGEKALIISPKLDFFPEAKKVPIPEVLIDPERLEQFVETRHELGNTETAFYLQCQLRQCLGLRGIDQYSIFAYQRNFWKEVCMASEATPAFVQILQERNEEAVLSISPNAFFRFQNIPLFKNRVLLIDEAEIFGNKLLFAPADEVSLFPFLQDESTSIAAQFFVKNICQEIVEPQLQHALGPFPEKILLSEKQTFPHLADAVLKIGAHENLQRIANFLREPQKEVVRWIRYDPETGNVTFGMWQPGDWREMKQLLGNCSKILFHRAPEKYVKDFLKIFIGVENGYFLRDPNLELGKKLTVPEKLESASDPQFNAFCAEKIIELAKEELTEDHWIAINFSSLETLKKIFTHVSEHFIDQEDISVLGERASGGDSKLFELLKKKKKVILFTQKLLRPELFTLPIKTLVVQKFPFPPPHPLLKELEDVFKRSGQNFWGTWIVPQVAANLSRRISCYPQATDVVWLDPRENARWGKEILTSLF
ncbi:3'-5' exonuclease [Candidatus Gracilibacteria bacterium]|nr:3'-5' exonuclease [Candidatus Gracilibacteria bacterium]